MKVPKFRTFSQLIHTPFKKWKLERSCTDPNQFAGRDVWARKELNEPDEIVCIETVKGNLNHPKYFEINGTHFCHIFSFYMQMQEHRQPTEEELKEFELASDIKDIKQVGK